MPHFFINSRDINENKILINDIENVRHLAKSLRIKPGERILLIDENRIQYETTVENVTNKDVIVRIEKSYPSERFLDFELYLAQSPLRNDGQSFIIEKSTELGVNGIYPVITDNCSVAKNIIEKKILKWQRIMYESSKQCERAVVPKCFDVSTIEKVLQENTFDKVIVFCERIAKKTIRDTFTENPINKGDKILVIIGPEGGFSQREFDYFKQKNLEMLTLGKLILRAETATVVGLGNIIYEFSISNRKN